MRPPPWLQRRVARHLESRQLSQHARAQQTQEKLLRTLLKRYRYTELGRELRLPEVQSPEQFRALVPTRTAHDYKPLWDRALTDNRPGVLHPKALEYTCVGSGTSGYQKYIPCPPELLALYRAFLNRAFFHAFSLLDDFSLLSEHILVTSAPPVREVAANGVVIGYGSGIASLKSAGFARKLVRPTPDVLAISDGREKVRRTIEETFDLDIRILTGIPLFVVPVLEELLRAAHERGIPARCARDVWPNLKLYLYSGSPIDLYEQRLRQLLGDGVFFYEVYSATETPVAYQYRKDERGLLLDVGAAYYEFEPLSGGARIPLHEVELGTTYDIVVTTQGGAFAYKLGDRVEFVSTYPFVLRFAGRDRDEINLGAEKLSLGLARKALDGACAATGAEVRQFFVCPTPALTNERRSHHWHVEFQRAPTDREAWLDALDATLQRSDQVYQQIRVDGTMPRPKLRELAPGTIDAHARSVTTYGQGKFLHLHNDRRVADALDHVSANSLPTPKTP